jgi:site-specific recombinase XerD
VRAEELVRAYLDESAPAWSPVSLASARRRLDLFVAFFRTRPLTRQAVLDYVREVWNRRTARGTPWASRTVHGVLLAARGFLKWAHLRGASLEDLASLVPRPRLVSLPRTLTEDEAARLLGDGTDGGPGVRLPCALRDRAILETLYGTGLRAAELAGLELDDVDLAAGLVHVRKGKGRKERLVPLGEAAAAAIHAYLSHDRPRSLGRLFLTKDGRALTTKALGSVVAAASRRAGLVTLASPHRLRHSYATHLLLRGASIVAIKSLLGHARLSSTEVYLGLEVSDLARMLAKSHPRERAPTLEKSHPRERARR